MKKILSALTIISVLILTFNSCYVRTRFKFLGEKDDIVSVDIMEIVPNEPRESFIEYHICGIDDVSGFLKNIRSLKYRTYLINDLLHYPEASILCFKITYNNDNYEFFDDSYHMVYTQSDGFDNRGNDSWFKEEKFYSLLFEYLPPAQEHKFNYMRPREEILSVEIIEQYADAEKTKEHKIDDIDLFLNELEAVAYCYEYEYDLNEKDELHKTENPLIKITYKNGGYEIFNHVARRQQTISAESEAYIGTFDEAHFYSLLEKYIK